MQALPVPHGNMITLFRDPTPDARARGIGKIRKDVPAMQPLSFANEVARGDFLAFLIVRGGGMYHLTSGFSHLPP